MPRGLKTGKNILECSCGYQFLFYAAILCVVYRKNPQKRRYETAVLEVGRKNFKTFTIATVFVLLFLLEPRFSKFYSVAPDGSLSREVKTAIEEILKSSPLIYANKSKNRFKILRDYIEFLPNENDEIFVVGKFYSKKKNEKVYKGFTVLKVIENPSHTENITTAEDLPF